MNETQERYQNAGRLLAYLRARGVRIMADFQGILHLRPAALLDGDDRGAVVEYKSEVIALLREQEEKERWTSWQEWQAHQPIEREPAPAPAEGTCPNCGGREWWSDRAAPAWKCVSCAPPPFGADIETKAAA